MRWIRSFIIPVHGLPHPCRVVAALCMSAACASAYTVTFDLGAHGTLISGELVQSVPEGGTAIAPAVLEQAGFIFSGWDVPLGNVTGDRTISAEYVPESLESLVIRIEEELAVDGVEVSDRFGNVVSLCGDTAVIGAEEDDDNGAESGAAYVLVRSAGVWTEQAKLTASDAEAGDRFGTSVCVRGDAILVGATGDGDNGSGSGSVYVFTRNAAGWAEAGKLTPSDGASGDQFGRSIAMDGDTALIGADSVVGTLSDEGAAYVFVLVEGSWVEEAKLTASETDGWYNRRVGLSVSLCGDRALVGAPYSGIVASVGCAYVFERTDGVWTERERLAASDGSGSDRFGISVSLSGDTAVVGALLGDSEIEDSGSAYVFVGSDGVWSEEAELVASDGKAYGHFGGSVGLRGNTLLVGAPYADGTRRGSGAVYVLERTGSSWTEVEKRYSVDMEVRSSARFGLSIALDGDTALIGTDVASAYFYDLVVPPVNVTFDLAGKGSRTGGGELSQVIVHGTAALSPLVEADEGWHLDSWSTDFSQVTEDLLVLAQYVPAYAVTFDPGDRGTILSGEGVQSVPVGGAAVAPKLEVADGWSFAGWDGSYADVTSERTLTAQYVPTSLAGVMERKQSSGDGVGNDGYGLSVSLCGETALVGAPFDRTHGFAHGAVYVYVKNGESWVEQAMLTASDAADGDWFGASVSLSGDTVLVGAPTFESSREPRAGSAYVFVRTGTIWEEQVKLNASNASPNDQFGHAVSVSGDTAVVGSYLADGDVEDSGAAYVFVSNAGEWTEQAVLYPGDPFTSGWFGVSVDIDGDTALIGSQYSGEDGAENGSAYVFFRSGTTWEEQAKLIASDGTTYDDFGATVSICGGTAVVGAPGSSGADSYSGAIYIFMRSGEAWTEEVKLFPDDGANSDLFGMRVDISGNVVLVGAPDGEYMGDGPGSAYAFERKEGSWRQRAKLLASDGVAGDFFGFPVAIDGNLVAVGASRSIFLPQSGSAYFYNLAVPPVTVDFDLAGHASRIGGGELSQTVIYGTAAVAPWILVDSGWGFRSWDADFSFVTEDMLIRGLFYDSTDSDTDGLWDGWEEQHFGAITVTDGSVDSDKDGQTDRGEFESGNDPRDGADHFALEVDLNRLEASLTLRFEGNSDLGNRRYRILWTDDLTSPGWNEMPPGPFAPDPGGVTERTYDLPSVGDGYFFKAEAFIEDPVAP